MNNNDEFSEVKRGKWNFYIIFLKKDVTMALFKRVETLKCHLFGNKGRTKQALNQ